MSAISQRIAAAALTVASVLSVGTSTAWAAGDVSPEITGESWDPVYVGDIGNRVLTLSPTTTDPITVTDVSVSGADADVFSVQPGGCIAQLTSPCSMPLTFWPTAAGTFSAELTVTSNASSSPLVIPLTGTALLRPANDKAANATVVAALPFSDVGDTTHASYEIIDDHGWCQGFGPSLWWSYTPTSDMTIDADTVGSQFDAVLVLATGVPGWSLRTFTCDDDRAGDGQALLSDVSLTGGVTYYFGLTGYQGASGAGAINIRMQAPPPPPPALTAEVRVTAGSVTRTGLVEVSGQLSCSHDGAHVQYLAVTVTQASRRFTSTGSAEALPWGAACGPFKVTVPSTNGINFTAGHASVALAGYVADQFGQAVPVDLASTVRLTGTR